GADQHRGLRAASLLARARRRPDDARLGRERGAAGGGAARGAGVRHGRRARHGDLMLVEAGFYRLWREDPERMWRFMRHWMKLAIRLLSPGAGYGIERLPATGGVVLAANHFSGIDPPKIGRAH